MGVHKVISGIGGIFESNQQRKGISEIEILNQTNKEKEKGKILSPPLNVFWLFQKNDGGVVGRESATP